MSRPIITHVFATRQRMLDFLDRHLWSEEDDLVVITQATILLNEDGHWLLSHPDPLED
jgi:hypothetical protein